MGNKLSVAASKKSPGLKVLHKHIHWVISVCVLILLGKQAFILHNVFGYSWHFALPDAVCGTLLISTAVWSLVLLIRAYPTKVTLYTYSVFISVIMAVVTVFAHWELVKWWLGTDPASTSYLFWLRNSLPVRLIMIWVFYAWMSTNAALRKNISAMDSRFQAQADANALLKEAELFKLRQQLQPHFLYNSLNSINALVMISPDRAQDMIGKLSDFLRGSVRRESEDTIPVNEELNYIESYLAIESIRFGDRLNVVFTKDFSETAKMPPFLFQPILENAIKFGLYGKTGAVQIDISIVTEGQMLTIRVTNPYDSSLVPPRGTGFGLMGISRRLYLLYARNDLLDTMKGEETFTTILKIPQYHA